MDRGVPWIVTDFKRSSRQLAALPGREAIRVLTLGRDFGATLRFNPLASPPGVPFEAHVRQVVELMNATYTGGDGVANALVTSIEGLAKQRPGHTPTFLEVREALLRGSHKGRSKLWLQTALRILERLTTPPLGGVLCATHDAKALARLRQGHTVLELDGLSRQDAAFVVQLILRYLHHDLLNEPQSGKLRLVVCLEEAQELAPKRDAATESIVETTMRQARQSGLGVWLATQSPATISPVVLGNVYTVVSLNLRSRSDILAASQSLQLDQEGAAMLGTLPTGQAICRLAGRWPRPVHLKIPGLHVDARHFSDRDILTRHLGKSSLDHDTPSAAPSADSAASAVDGSPPAHPESNTALPPPERTSSRSDSASRRRGLRAESEGLFSASVEASELLDNEPVARALLRDIAERPFVGVAERYRALGVSIRKGDAAKRALIETGLIEPRPIAVPEGKVMLLELTDDGRANCIERSWRVAPYPGGIEHGYWIERAAALLTSRGWAVRRERQVNGRRLDIWAERHGTSLALQCETGRSDWAVNEQHLEDESQGDLRVVLWIGPEPCPAARWLHVIAPHELGDCVRTWSQRPQLRQPRLGEH